MGEISPENDTVLRNDAAGRLEVGIELVLPFQFVGELSFERRHTGEVASRAEGRARRYRLTTILITAESSVRECVPLLVVRGSFSGAALRIPRLTGFRRCAATAA